jgi:hypothetical protein
MFCVAIPATLVAGVSAERRQQTERGEARARGDLLPKRQLPVRPISLGLTGLLIGASILYHSRFPF